MPTSDEICKEGNNSTLQATSADETGITTLITEFTQCSKLSYKTSSLLSAIKLCAASDRDQMSILQDITELADITQFVIDVHQSLKKDEIFS